MITMKYYSNRSWRGERGPNEQVFQTPTKRHVQHLSACVHLVPEKSGMANLSLRVWGPPIWRRLAVAELGA